MSGETCALCGAEPDFCSCVSFNADAECAFCQIIHGQAVARILSESTTVVIFEPLEPHAEGHVLVVPRMHVPDASTDPGLTGGVFRAAAIWLRGREGNILTSQGPLATQTVRHLHVHVVPRTKRDELHPDWPWMRDLFRRRTQKRRGLR